MTATVAPLRAVRSDATTTPLSAERQRLAGAIDRLAEAQARVTRTLAALNRSTDLGIDRMHAEDAAGEALALARQAEPRRLVDALMGDDPAAGPTAAEAERAYVAAKAAHEAIDVARSTIGAELRAAQNSLNTAQRARDAALSEMLRASPELQALIADFERTQRRYGALRGALKWLATSPRWALTERQRGSLDTHHDFFPGDPLPILAQWQPAVAALQHDAAAPLPGDNPNPKDAA